MYVQCERCQAEYEFDDALVSERGTTVKCTSCGHQFKIKRAGAAGEGDRWVVTTQRGEQLTFNSLKELQRAIVAKTVSRNDQLSRNNAAPKPLGSITELEPFFEQHRARQPSFADRPAPVIQSKAPPLPAAASVPPRNPSRPAPAEARPGSRPSFQPPPMPSRVPTLRPSPNKPSSHGAGPWSGEDTPTHAMQREGSGAHAPPVAPPQAGATATATTGASAPPPVAPKADGRSLRVPPPPPPRRSLSSRPDNTPAPAPRPPARSVPPPPSIDPNTSPLPTAATDGPRGSYSDSMRLPSASITEGAPYSIPPRRRVGGWVVGVALIAGVSAVGLYMINRARGNPTTETKPAVDPRVAQFLSSGEAALAQGNLDLAKENLDKAGALAEHSPDVLLATARLAAARADVAWLRQKLLVADSDEAKLNKQTLDDLGSAARRAADEAQKGAPEDIALLRARIDALRIAGDGKAARALVDRILPTGSQPETAYVLAALDLAETDPPWSVVISRLRAAAAGEGTASRARAALVYALGKSGDGPEARKELERLGAQPRLHPLLGTLRAFLDRTVAEGKDGGAPVASNNNGGSVDVARLPTQATGPGPGPVAANPGPNPAGANPNPNPNPGAGTAPPTGDKPPAAAGLPSDPRTLLRMAEAAKGKRDFERAKTLYEAALAKNGSDSEALAGMGDVSRMTGDIANAQSYYKKALGVNPSYLPAMIGLADVQWDQGDKGGAQRAYREIVDRFPEPAYPARVKTRAEGGAAE